MTIKERFMAYMKKKEMDESAYKQPGNASGSLGQALGGGLGGMNPINTAGQTWRSKDDDLLQYQWNTANQIRNMQQQHAVMQARMQNMPAEYLTCIKNTWFPPVETTNIEAWDIPVDTLKDLWMAKYGSKFIEPSTIEDAFYQVAFVRITEDAGSTDPRKMECRTFVRNVGGDTCVRYRLVGDVQAA